jgi:ferredoxin-2, mitochondrial
MLKELFIKNKMNDIQIQVIDRQGVNHQLTAPTDMNLNLMELCKVYGLPVEGTCGGMALCASCHVYILSEHSLNEKKEAEEAMLGETFHVKGNSRLGCQIILKEELKGLSVQLAREE